MTNKSSDSSLVLTSFKKAGNLKAKQGDLIEIDRTIYSHWALYIGRGEVVHVACENLDDGATKAYIVKCRLVDLAGPGLVRVNNKYVAAKRRGLVSLKSRTVINNALSMVGQRVHFNWMNKNSEHYVTGWKYGVSWSDQSTMAKQAMTIFSSSTTGKMDDSVHTELSRSIKSLLRCKVSNPVTSQKSVTPQRNS